MQPQPPMQPDETEIRRALGALFGVAGDDAAVLAFMQQVELMVQNRYWAELPLRFQGGELTEVGGVTFRRERAGRIR